MGKISKMAQQRMVRFGQKQMKLDELTQPGWEHAADYFSERDTSYGTSDLRVPAVVKPQTDDDAAAPAPTTCGELFECLGVVPGILQMPQGTSRPGSSHIWLASGKPKSSTSISGLAPPAVIGSSLIQNAKPVELVSFDPCIQPPQLIIL